MAYFISFYSGYFIFSSCGLHDNHKEKFFKKNITRVLVAGAIVMEFCTRPSFYRTPPLPDPFSPMRIIDRSLFSLWTAIPPKVNVVKIRT